MEKWANNTFSGVATGAALGLIAIYQRWVSPRKGYRCAYAVLHGGPGCSGFAKQAITQHGLWQALGAIRRRFRDCRAAMRAIMAQQSEGPEDEIMQHELDTAKRQRKKRMKEGWCTWNDCAIAGCEAPGACCGGTGTAAGGAALETKAGICGVLGSLGAIGCCGN